MKDTLDMLALDIMDNLAQRLVQIVLAAAHKEPDELTDIERVAIAIGGGADYEFTSTGVRVTVPFGIQKINGQFIVRTAVPTNE